MAIYRNAHFTFAGTDLSTFVRSLSLNTGQEVQDSTAMGATARINAAGLDTWTVEVEFNQSYASGGPDETLRSASSGTIEIRPDSGSVSATNPSYTGTAIIAEYVPQAGPVGNQHTCTLSLVAGTALTIATS